MAEVQHKERAHALLSASGAERWLNCTASARLEENLPEQTSSYAEQGTLAHELAESMLKVDLKIKPMNTYRQELNRYKANKHWYASMPEDVMPYVNYVKEQYAEAKREDEKAKLFIEKKFDLQRYVQDGFGTSDCAIVYNEVLEVIDLKFGEGKLVSAVENTQLKYYALGVLEVLGPEDLEKVKQIRLTICQPRMQNISSWSISKKSLIEWAETVLQPKAEEAYDGLGEQVPGDWCQFCKARPRCAKLDEQAVEEAKKAFGVQSKPKLLTDEQLVESFKRSSSLKKWLSAVEETILSEAVAGKEFPGLKVVQGRSNRQITDEAKAVQALKDDLYEETQFMNSKLKGLGDLEKLLTKKGFEACLGHLIIKPEGAPTLVEESDPREPWGASQAKKDFADVDLYDLD